ncbi:GntR family transcriptional regulator/MocR family aminotransferase [Paenibacillus phyllosphaerae]|uniref:GntR family transcriptional regulator/MocR family aminotransferase n=1 Tax=Paenibacillus phyllosphaerae TaxID=274593 RepID=A0A7W5B478_9BACL|nr:PLP-dependent aminotransferase family protein [Paenibacillus phyllosphaerae]MBB3113656.1 GntR family transcriptional regulator/MocR family aminotransferase [Paenibacillus phyllosphaerae]
MDFLSGYDTYYAAFGRKTEALYHAIKDAIVSGLAEEGMRLPSSRELAGRHGLSRGVVNQVYDMLYADGYVRTEAGSGTFVAYQRKSEGQAREAASIKGKKESAHIALSAWAERLQPAFPPRIRNRSGGGSGQVIDFNIASFDSKLFPAEEWKKVMYAEIRALLEPHEREPGEGYRPLREAIALDLWRERGIRADASRIMLTNGSMEALALLTMLLITPDDPVVIENPTYPGIVQAVRAAGGKLVLAPVDDAGIVPSDWKARLLFVTPTRHFPTGAVLSIERRRALLDWADRQGAVIIEDDYDSTFRWGGRPVEPLKALDRDDRVVYVGTFSRTMLGDQRIGYVLLPEVLVEPFRRAKLLLHPTSSGTVSQRGLASFMASGGYERHIRRIRRVSGRRLQQLQQDMKRQLGRWFRIVETDAGLHLFAFWLGESGSYARLREACRAEGVYWTDGARYWVTEPEKQVESERGAQCPPTALFGFAHLEEEQIAEGISRIASIAGMLFGGDNGE